MKPRDLRDRFFYGDSSGHDLFVYILENCHWNEDEPAYFSKMGKEYEVKFGQFYTTETMISEWLGWSRKKTSNKLNSLKTKKLISIKKYHNCMMLELCPAFLQCISTSKEHQKNIKRTAKGATNEQDNNKQLNKNNPKGLQKESHLAPPSNSRDEEGTPNMFENSPDKKKSKRPRKPKNTPPVDLNTLVGTSALSDIKNAWNEHCGDLPKLRGFNDKRLKKVQRCWDELGLSDLTLFSKAVSNLSKSKWALSERHDFDWLINSSSTLERAFNGYYNKDFSKKSDKKYDPAKDPGTREYFADEVAEQAKYIAEMDKQNPNWRTEFTPAQLAEMDNPDF